MHGLFLRALSSRIALRLRAEHFGISAAAPHQLLMTAVFPDNAVLDENDLISRDGGRETVRDKYHRLALACAVHLSVQLALCERVKRGGGLVENDYRTAVRVDRMR